MIEESSHAFGSTEPYTVGVEEELFLADPVTGAQTNASTAVLERVGTGTGTVERELHACQIELISPVCSDVAGAVESLSELRRDVLGTGAGLIGSGTHPAAAEGAAEITDKKRYERIRDLLGDAVATPVAGLHIHVGMPDPETAIRAFNGLRRHLPMLQALGANSPFRHCRDTGLASAREVSVRGWPRSGVPRAMADYEDFLAATRMLVQAADVPDYTWFWWKLRPHPRLGTVEIRALDAQSSLEDISALVALTHCLARGAATADPRPDPPAEILEEGIFRAARWGVHARLPDVEGRLRPLAELLAEALAGAREHATELGCEAELGGLAGLVARGGGAGRQRAVYEIAGMDALLRELLRLTSPGEA
jgi:glutamate---cysteine ligase / carboxylate-amine ligase